jgi:hypothetical protein
MLSLSRSLWLAALISNEGINPETLGCFGPEAMKTNDNDLVLLPGGGMLLGNDARMSPARGYTCIDIT